MMCSYEKFIKKLADSWLELIHFSVFSYNYKIHDFLIDTPWSWLKLIKSIENALKYWIRVQINTVINHYNENHLDKTVIFLIKRFPELSHFIWNNLDPLMMRKTETAMSTLPNFDNFKSSLKNAMDYLSSIWRNFRVEKMPLCYIEWYEWASTETRKIVKSEERIVHFLDDRKIIRQFWYHWEYNKLEWCKKFDLNNLCSWIYEYNKFYNYVKVYPKSISRSRVLEIIWKIKGFNFN